jgi:hypothetical protein
MVCVCRLLVWHISSLACLLLHLRWLCTFRVDSHSANFFNSHVHPVVWQAYGRAVALQEASPVFALLQSGNILLSLASFTQASEMFHSALDKAPQHVVAQCGLGTALLGRAHECISTGAFAWAATLLEVLSRMFFPSKAVSPAVCVSCECHLD